MKTTTEKRYAVYTKDTIECGMLPYIVWGTSEKSISAKWFRKYSEFPIKIVPVTFNPETGNYEPEAK